MPGRIKQILEGRTGKLLVLDGVAVHSKLMYHKFKSIVQKVVMLVHLFCNLTHMHNIVRMRQGTAWAKDILGLLEKFIVCV